MKKLTKEQRYWLKRKDNQMWELMEEAEIVAKQMAKYYASSSAYIQEKISGIYNRFKTEHHLTDKEAKQLLNSVKNKDDINELINKIKNMPKSAEKAQLIAELESPAYASRIRRLQEAQDLIDDNVSMIYKQDIRRTEKLLKNVANESYYETMYDIQARTGAAFSFSALDPKKVDKLLKRKWAGSSFSDRIWSNTQHLAETVKDELMLNFLTGRTEDEASKSIMDRYQVGYNQARRLVRTESAYIANEMDADAYEEAGITHYMIVATLDLRTSEICQEMDGKIFLLKDKQVGENFPPFHPWCRTTTIEAEDLEELKSMKRRARDPKTGKNYIVPAGTTYQEWYKGLEEKHGVQQVKKWEREAKGIKPISTSGVLDQFDRKGPKVKGTPYWDDLVKTNPNYATKEYGYTHNCQRCVPTYELRKRGYNVEALPVENVDTDYIAIHPFGVWKHDYKDILRFENRQNVEELMKEWGNGSRAQITFKWYDEDEKKLVGHTFVVQQSRGKTFFIDPQTGSYDCSHYFEKMVNPKAFCHIMRIDNKNPSDLIENCCKSRR